MIDPNERDEFVPSVSTAATAVTSGQLAVPLSTLAACAVVLTGHVLGAGWPSDRAAGMPSGVWVVVAATLGAWLLHARGKRRRAEEQAFEERWHAARMERKSPAEQRRAARIEIAPETVSEPAEPEKVEAPVVVAKVKAGKGRRGKHRPVEEQAAGDLTLEGAPEREARPMTIGGTGESQHSSEEPADRGAKSEQHARFGEPGHRGRREPIFRPTWRARGLREGLMTLAARGIRAGGAFFGGGHVREWTPESEPRLARSLSAWLDDRQPAVRPIRVGLRLSSEVAGAIIGEDRSADTEWLRVDDRGAAEELCRRHLLDAIITDEGKDLALLTLENNGREAAWYDWGGQRPLSYFSIFPMRVDCSRATLTGATEALYNRPEAAGELVRSLARAAGALSRHPLRLTLADRLAGRISTFRFPADGVGRASLEPVNSAVLQLAGAVEMWGASADRPGREAARVASAWLASSAASLGEPERLRLIEAAARAAGDEPEIMLRLAATRLGLADERLGMDALLRADRMLRDRGVLAGIDPVTLIQAELNHGTFGEMTLGRVAAGICLVCATTPADRISYIREDLLEDMRFAEWLVGRDQDHALLIEIFRQLERARRAETFGLPAAA